MAEDAPDLARLAEELRNDADRVLVLGSGGTSLAPRLFAEAFAPAEGFPRLSVLDTAEPGAVAAAADEHDPGRTLYVVASRTGATLEPNLLFDFFFDQASRTLGETAGRRFLVVTEAGSALDTEGAKRRVRAVLPAEGRASGAFGSLSQFGLVPAALMGVDVVQLAKRAVRMAEACKTPGPENPGLLLGAALGAEALAGRDKLTLSIGPPAGRLGAWIEALVASATCKEGKGIVPVEGEPLGAPAVYGFDRFFVRCETSGAEDPGVDHLLASLVEHGHPLAGFTLRDPLDLGAEMFRWQVAAAVAARMFGVNPFDESDARDARDRTNRLLAAAAPAASQAEAPVDGARALQDLLASLAPGGFLAITAFLPESPAATAALEALRVAVRAARKVATIAGFGSRALHTTGQLRQGGRSSGVVLQLTGGPRQTVLIPGRPWDFARVFEAQADGDLEALESRKRTVARVRLGAEPAEGIAALTAAVGREVAV